MASVWFLTGILTTLAVLVALLPLLRRLGRWPGLPSFPWQLSVVAAIVTTLLMIMFNRTGAGDSGNRIVAAAPMPTGASTSSSPSSAMSSSVAAGAFGTAAKVFGSATAAALPAGPTDAPPAGKANAGSMEGAIANLEARLAKGGGTPGDWELLAKSFEFLGRPADAAKARAHQLPPLGSDAPGAAPTGPAMMGSAGALSMGAASPAGAASVGGVAVSGEVSLDAKLTSKASAGETLFIIAKSVDSPGMPVAVFRSSVGSWPVKFTLDDSKSMMPGRTLSSVGRVTIEARISKKGQPLPAAGDLQGSSGIINPSEAKPLKIMIDRELS